MALFDSKSRYVDPPVDAYAALDIRGRAVRALAVPEPAQEIPVGKHQKKQGQTLDQLATAYLGDPHAYWRLAELNDVFHPDALADVELLLIPTPTR